MRHAYLFCQAGARVLFAFHWSQALSEGGSVPKEIRDQMFKPGMNHWGYGWFVTKMAPGEPGAGTTLEEMCGDMPGNYFSWILRYPEQDDVITRAAASGYTPTSVLRADQVYLAGLHLPYQEYDRNPVG